MRRGTARRRHTIVTRLERPCHQTGLTTTRKARRALAPTRQVWAEAVAGVMASGRSARDRASCLAPALPACADHVDTLIVSDLHLGLPASRPRDLLGVLEQWRFERLILLGDMFHDWSFRHLCADTWRLLAHIRSLSQRREAEVVWVLGNHDRHLAHLVAKLVGRRDHRDRSAGSYDGRSFVALHGDRFDRFISTYARTSAFFSACLRLHPALAVQRRRVAEAARPGACRLQQPEPAGRGRRLRLCQRAGRRRHRLRPHPSAKRTVFDQRRPERQRHRILQHRLLGRPPGQLRHRRRRRRRPQPLPLTTGRPSWPTPSCATPPCRRPRPPSAASSSACSRACSRAWSTPRSGRTPRSTWRPWSSGRPAGW